MTFTAKRLAGGTTALVSGEDINGVLGQTVLSTTQWDDIKATLAFKKATAKFDAAVEVINAPLAAALEELEADKLAATSVTDDPTSYVDLEPEVEGTPSSPGNRVRLNTASIVLRLIEAGDTSRLVWVNGELAVLEA